MDCCDIIQDIFTFVKDMDGIVKTMNGTVGSIKASADAAAADVHRMVVICLWIFGMQLVMLGWRMYREFMGGRMHLGLPADWSRQG